MYEIHFAEIEPPISEIIPPDQADNPSDLSESVDYTPLLQDINKNLENITILLQEQNETNQPDKSKSLNQIKDLLKDIESSVSSNSIEIEEAEEEVSTVSINSIMDTPLSHYNITESLSFMMFGVLSLAVILFVFFDRR